MTTTPITPADLKARIVGIQAEIDDIRARAKPHRDKLLTVWVEVEAARKKWNAAKAEILPLIREIEAPIVELTNEQTMLAKATGGRMLSEGKPTEEYVDPKAAN